MEMYELIIKKRDGGELTPAEVRFVVEGYVSGEVPDYQMSAFAMAVYFKGMTDEELFALTDAMANSGASIDFSDIPGIKADKHSSGGVGDKTTLVLAPMCAAAGLKMVKFSGPGLGFTGGTIDKLAAIPGFRTSMSEAEIKAQVADIGLAVGAATPGLDPADKKLYALRDVTGTVESMPLIASSIMSKKLAMYSDVLVLDVKVGKGALMKTQEDAEQLSRLMVTIGNGAGKKTAAVITSMDQPLGYAAGNALEVIEAIEALNGGGPADLRELCIKLGAQLMVLADLADEEQAEKEMRAVLDEGFALAKFREMVDAQGGDISYIDEPEKLYSHKVKHEVKYESADSAYITAIDAEEIGLAVKNLGGGREKKEDEIDYGVGVVLAKKTGEKVTPGEVTAIIYAKDEPSAKKAAKRTTAAFKYSTHSTLQTPLIRKIIK